MGTKKKFYLIKKGLSAMFDIQTPSIVASAMYF